MISATGTIAIRNGGRIDSDTNGSGAAGGILVQAGRLLIDGGGLDRFTGISSDAQPGSSGDAGGVAVDAEQVMITANGQIRSQTFTAGNAGAIQVEAGSLVIRDGNDDTIPTGILSDAEVGSTGDAGAVLVSADQIEILGGGQIRAITRGSGDGGAVAVNAGDLTLDAQGATALLTAISSSAAPGASGSAGTVQVIADGAIQLLDGAQIRSQTFGPGNAGTVRVVADDLLIRDANTDDSPTGILSDAGEGSTGDAGAVLVSARTIRLEAGGQIRSVTLAEGNAGAVGIEGEHLIVTADGQTAIVTGVLSSAEPGSSGDAGAIFLDVDHIELLAGGQIRALTFSSGDAGGIGIQTGNLSISSEGFTELPTGILSNAEIGSSGHAGTILLFAEDTVEVTDAGQIDSSSAGFGRPGNVLIDVGRLVLTDGGVIGSAALGPVATLDDLESGNVRISARQEMTISGEPDRPSGVTTDTAGLRNGGDLRIATPRLELANDALVSSSTFGLGQAGSVILDVGELILGPQTFVSSASPNQAAADFSGGSGQVLIVASDAIRIEAAAFNDRPAGITTSTVTRGPAGLVAISTPLLTIEGGGQISSATTGLGAGGPIFVEAGRIQLGSGSTITTRSISPDPAAGVAGGITLIADSLRIRDGASVSAETAAAEAGDIEISANRLVELRESAVTTSVADGQGSGGNILIDPQFVVLDGSRIVANAREGAGGNIRIVAGNFFTTADSLIDASSELGIDGTVEVTAPDLDLTSELAVLPTAYIDVSGLLRESCAARASNRTSSFTASGAGGVAPDPSAPLAGRYAVGGWGPTPAAFPTWALSGGDRCDD